MADIKYFFLEQGGAPEVFSYGGRCWKKLPGTSETGETITGAINTYNTREECLCDYNVADPIDPDCDSLLLNVQALTTYAADYSPKMHELITIGPVTYEQNTNIGPAIGSIKFDNTDQNNPAYITLNNSTAGEATAPDFPGDYSIQYWMNVTSIPYQEPEGRYIGVILDGRAVGITSNNNEVVQYVERDGDGFRLNHGSTLDPPENRLISNILEYNTGYQVAVSRKDGVEKMYITGEFHSERNFNTSYNNKNLVIGQHPWNLHSDVNSRYGLDGYLQDIRISNVATHNCYQHTVNDDVPTICNEWRSIPEFEYDPGQSARVVVQASSVGYHYIVSGYSHWRYQKIYIDGVQVLNAAPYRGMLISKLRETNGQWELVEYFGNTQDFWAESNVNQAQTLLQSFEDGEMLVLNTGDEPYAYGYTSRLYDELETFGAGSGQYSALNSYRSSYLLISIKGMPADKHGNRFFRSVGSSAGAPLAHTVYLI